MTPITSTVRILSATALAAALTACADSDSDTAAAPSTVVDTTEVTVTEQVTDTPPEEETVTETAVAPPDTETPPVDVVESMAQIPESDPTPYRSDQIFPAQSGLQFTGPDGTFCEMYGESAPDVESPVALCTHQGEGDINAVSVREGEPATTHNVNRIFMAHADTRALAPGQRIANGRVSCAIAEGDTRVMCAVGPHGFVVSTGGVELS